MTLSCHRKGFSMKENAPFCNGALFRDYCSFSCVKKTEIKEITQVIAKMMIQARACEALNGFAFDVMIFSCASIDSTSTYESTDDVASFKYVSKRYGKKKILIVDSSKFDKSNPCRSFFLNSFDLILTDARHEIVDPIKEQEANIITSSEK